MERLKPYSSPQTTATTNPECPIPSSLERKEAETCRSNREFSYIKKVKL